MADRPALKIAIKPKEQGAKSTTVLAFWRGDRGLNGALDRNVVELAARLEDGSILRIKRGQDGKATAWINAYEDDAAPQSRPAAPARQAAPRQSSFRDDPDGGLDPDDMPF